MHGCSSRYFARIRGRSRRSPVEPYALLLRAAVTDLETTAAGRRRRRGHGHLEHAVAEGRLRLVGHGARRQRNDSTEAAVAALALVVALALLFVLGLPFPLNRHGVLGQID